VAANVAPAAFRAASRMLLARDQADDPHRWYLRALRKPSYQRMGEFCLEIVS